MTERLKPELDAVCAVIDEFLEESALLVRVPVRRTAEKKGKLLRPMLLVLTAKCGTYDQQSTVTVAAALELMHIASLIHDDIVDEGVVRRGSVTVQSEFGKDVAVYAGDYTLARSVSVLSSLNDLSLVKMFIEAMTNVCRGEITQHSCRYKVPSTEEYIQMVAQKTGELFALSLEAGAYLAGMEPDARAALREIGRIIGVAYQIYDDCLDYTVSGSKALKDTQKDISQGSYTLPLLCAMECDHSGKLRRLLKKPLTDAGIQEIIRTVRDLRGPETAMEYATNYFIRITKGIRELSFQYNINLDGLMDGIDLILETIQSNSGRKKAQRESIDSPEVLMARGLAGGQKSTVFSL